MHHSHQIVFCDGREEPGWNGVGLRRHHNDFHHQHDNHSGKCPVSCLSTLFAHGQQERHDGPRYIEDGHLDEKLCFAVTFVVCNPFLSEFVVHISQFQVHENIIGLFDTVEFIRGVGRWVLIWVQLQSKLFVRAFDFKRVRFTRNIQNLIIVGSLLLEFQARFDCCERRKEGNSINNTLFPFETTRSQYPCRDGMDDEHVEEKSSETRKVVAS
mmetsp:Transcript_29231/g.79101  ORF Transcript_29231/g.79101 Transcript_29231/m.79101 type:complete len:213 (+) Transcript_29231:1491-2129(+)